MNVNKADRKKKSCKTNCRMIVPDLREVIKPGNVRKALVKEYNKEKKFKKYPKKHLHNIIVPVVIIGNRDFLIEIFSRK
jgi:hypothetical protein